MRRALVSVAVAALTAVMAVPAAAGPGDVAIYELNEATGAVTMQDSSGNGLDGVIGNEVVTGVVVDDATGYRFARLPPNQPPAHPEHNVLVPHSEQLNPGSTGRFSVTVRYRTTNSFGNLVQKGQSTTRGGYFKIQLPQGEPSCLFRDGAGATNATRSPTRIDDGAWHTVQCLHTPGPQDVGMVELFVDGVKVGQNRGAIGSIGNDEPLSLGGKNNCDQITVTCDYFGGDVDHVRITRPDAAVDQPPTAFFPAPVCDQLTCLFDGSGSSDPENGALTHAWMLGDARATGPRVSHTFPAAGTYRVVLTVTDPAGQTGTTERDVTVSATSQPAVAFRAEQSSTGSSLRPSVTAPAEVVAGDSLLLFLSVNRTTPVSELSGWTPVGTHSGVAGEPMTHVWHRTADAADAGRTVDVVLGTRSKFDLTLAAYSGVDPVRPFEHVQALAETVYQSTHTSPAAPALSGSDRLLSYWTDKTSSSTDWAPPAGTVQRAEVIGAGRGRVNALLTESDSGTGGLVAVSAAASKKAVAWSIVLNALGGTSSAR